ncbi:hypothetical protein PISMIDRAFT_440879 [Pisolithus microcarpus 441]|uniref:Uncharacterized protein n=1 Tax=Pisolithus microcarpus 441 TaxID=765257 RepID=A0A0C9ZUR7_9AGAM|nr:hypothetical protein PISMIDRAFT_440879 [Pisolithus microcarpus 441]
MVIPVHSQHLAWHRGCLLSRALLLGSNRCSFFHPSRTERPPSSSVTYHQQLKCKPCRGNGRGDAHLYCVLLKKVECQSTSCKSGLAPTSLDEVLRL